MVGLMYQEEGRNRDYLEEIARNGRGFRPLRSFCTSLEVLLRSTDSSRFKGSSAVSRGPRRSPVKGWGGEGQWEAKLRLEKEEGAKMADLRAGSRI